MGDEVARKDKNKQRKNAWVTEDLKGQRGATAMIMEVAQATGQSLEETAESFERLESMGLIRREPDGSVILLTPKKRS